MEVAGKAGAEACGGRVVSSDHGASGAPNQTVGAIEPARPIEPSGWLFSRLCPIC
jgi:hypothetical protein